MNSIIGMIDHAVLQPVHTDQDVREACALCERWQVASICVKPCHVPLARTLLADSRVVVSTVVGFPHGGSSTSAKVAETIEACRFGAREVDMVVNLGKVLADDWDYVATDIAGVVSVAAEHKSITKVIFETGLLPSDAQKIRLCEISDAARAAFVKTSTGFGFVKGASGQLASTGATVADVILMRKHTSDGVQVKASGGIRSFADALRMVEAGATRLGTSATAAIAAGATAQSDY